MKLNLNNIAETAIDWAHGYGNSPTLHILYKAGHMPQFNDHEPIWNYEVDSGMVWAEIEGLISFLYMGNGMREGGFQGGFRGYGGREMTRTLTNNSIMVSNDCWSGRAELLPFECVDVSISDAGERWTTTMAIRVEDFQEIIAALGFHIVPDYRNKMHEISAYPDRAGKPSVTYLHAN